MLHSYMNWVLQKAAVTPFKYAPLVKYVSLELLNEAGTKLSSHVVNKLLAIAMNVAVSARSPSTIVAI